MPFCWLPQTCLSTVPTEQCIMHACMHAGHVLSAHAHNLINIMQVKVVNRFMCAAAALISVQMQMQRVGYVLLDYRALVSWGATFVTFVVNLAVMKINACSRCREVPGQKHHGSAPPLGCQGNPLIQLYLTGGTCFLKFLLCYALMPNAKPTMVCSLFCTYYALNILLQ